MVDVLKLIVLLLCILVSVLLCFVTTLFLKKQNFYIDFQSQYKKDKAEQGGVPCEEDVNESQDCLDVENSADEEDFLARLVISKNPRSNSNHARREPDSEGNSSNASEPGFNLPICEPCNYHSEPSQTVHEKQPYRASNSQREEKRDRSSVNLKRRSESAGKRQEVLPVRTKCVSFHHSPPDQRLISARDSFMSDEDHCRDRRRSFSNQERRKVDCVLIMDPAQLTQGGNERSKYTVLPVTPYNSSCLNQGAKNTSAKSQVHALASGMQHQTYNVQCTTTSPTPLHKKVTSETSSTMMDGTTGEDSPVEVKVRVSQGCRNSVLDNAVDTPIEDRIIQKRRQSEHSEDQVNLTAISRHNLEKLREKRKERKRTLLKLQYESGKLQDGLQRYFSETSDCSL